jgi:hypothetical protein
VKYDAQVCQRNIRRLYSEDYIAKETQSRSGSLLLAYSRYS